MLGQQLEDFPTPLTIRVQVLEKEEGQYISYIVVNLDGEGEGEYLLVTQYPNWKQKPIKIGDVGYLTYYYIVAGVSNWYNDQAISQDYAFIPYKYTQNVLVKFIPDTSEIIKKDTDKNFKIKIN